MDQVIAELMTLAAGFASTSPKMFGVVVTLLILILVPKALARITKSRAPRFAAACELVCTDVIKLACILLRKAPPVAALAFVWVASNAGLTACANVTHKFLYADSSDGHHWRWCSKWTEGNEGSVQFWQLACADTNVLLEQRKREIQSDHPRALFSASERVSQ